MVLMSSEPSWTDARKQKQPQVSLLDKIDLYRDIVRRKAIWHCRSLPSLEMDDLIQESLLVIVERLQCQIHPEEKDVEETLSREVENTMSRVRYAHRKTLRQTQFLDHHETQVVIFPIKIQAESDEQRTILENALSLLTSHQRDAIKTYFDFDAEVCDDKCQLDSESPRSKILRSRVRRGLKSLSKITEVRELYSEISA